MFDSSQRDQDFECAAGEGPPGGALPYKHFGARLARLGRFDSWTLYQGEFAPVVQRTRIVGLHPTDAVQLPNGAPDRISSKVEPATDNREVLVRFQHPAPFIRGLRNASLLRPRQLLALSRRSHWLTKYLKVKVMGDWQRWLMHSPLKRDQAGSIPASPIKGLRDWQMRLCTRAFT